MSHLEKWCQFAKKYLFGFFGFFGMVLAETIAPKGVLDMKKVENAGSRRILHIITAWRGVDLRQYAIVSNTTPVL